MNRFFVLKLVFAASLGVSLSSCEPTESAATISQEVKTKNMEKAKESSRLETTIELESGIYGIRFGATTEEVMKWCSDNYMAIVNPTEKDVKENARRAVRRIRDLKETYDLEVESLTPLEQELLKLAQAYSEARDIFELAKIVGAQEKLEVLKNPTVSYKDQKYYLQSVHTGMKTDVGNEKKVCTDDRITKTAYRLNLTPTEKSEKMLANGLRGLDVLFYRDAEKGLITYATVAMLGGSSERSANIQFELVLTAIRQKYGAEEFIPRWSSNNDQRAYDIILDDIYHLLGVTCDISFFWENTAVAWARNLIIFRDLRGSAFQVLYYDQKAAAQISELYSRAIEDFKKECYEKKKQTLAQMKQDF